MKRIDKLNQWAKLSDKEKSDKIANELEQRELEYLKKLMSREIYKMNLNDVAFEGGYIEKLYSKLIVLTKNK